MATASAVALIRTTRVVWAWIFIATALVLMTGRRAITLSAVIAGRTNADLSAELVALMISVTLLAGIALIRPVFVRMRNLAEELSHRERELRELIDVAPEGIALVRDASWLYANAALTRLLGAAAVREAQQQPIVNLVHPDDRALLEQSLLAEQVEASVGRAQEVRFRVADGAYVTLELVFGPVIFHHGAPARLLQLRDLSERKAMEAKLVEASKMEAIGRLSGGIAHDFNNILTVVVASTSLAREVLHPSHPALAEVATIEEAAARATGLVSQLLAFARTQPVSPTAFDLNQLLSDLGGMLKRLVREDVHIRTLFDPEPVPVFADHGQIDQVVMNLVVNACDAMAQGGTLTLQTLRERRPDDAPHVPARGVLLVSDEGCGLAPEVKARIFEPFFTTKAAGAGTGLGLSSCYGIVTRAGGRIDVTSTQGEGTTFRVTLPGADAVAMQARASSRPPASACVERILLVEDESLVRRLAARCLRAHGYEVLEADSGEPALELLQQVEALPALLVTDVVMPGLDGPSLATRVRARYPDLPILFITGYGEHVLAKSGMWADAEILKKPFSPATLCERVRRMLDSHSVRRARKSVNAPIVRRTGGQ